MINFEQLPEYGWSSQSRPARCKGRSMTNPRALLYTFADFRRDMNLVRVEPSWGDYEVHCDAKGIPPRKPDGDINNCALVRGESAQDCQMCPGRCPDAVRLFQRAAGASVVTAAELEAEPAAERAAEPTEPAAAEDATPLAHAFAHSSASVEHYSPFDLVGAAARVFGGTIDLDPASCDAANEYIEATTYYDAAANGLKQTWAGSVWLNPPGGLCDEDGRPCYPRTRKREGCTVTGACGLEPGHQHKGVTSSAKHWWAKLAREWSAGHLTQAVFLGFSLEQLGSTQSDVGPGLLTPLDCVLCLPRKRVRYLHQDPDGALVSGDAPPHSSFLAYLGPNTKAFTAAFEPFGRVLVGHHDLRSVWWDETP